MSAKLRHASHTHEAYRWLGTGALMLGVGVATLTGGAGIAEAGTGEHGGPAGSGHSTADHKTAAASTPKKSHSPADLVSRPTAAPASTAVAVPTATSGPTPKPAPTANTKAPKPVAVSVSSVIDTKAAKPSAATTATTVAAVVAVAATPKAAAATTTTATVTNPITALVTAIQKALLSFQAMFFNTPPTITAGAPTKNADGTYTGQIVASDIDGDPLDVYVEYGGARGTTTLQAVNTATNTYTYTYTPSATVATGTTDTLTFGAQETNAASHYHGFSQLLAFIEYQLEPPLYKQEIGYYPSEWGTTTTDVVVTVA